MITAISAVVRSVMNPVLVWKNNLMDRGRDVSLEGINIGIVVSDITGGDTPLRNLIENRLKQKGAEIVPVSASKVAILARMEVVRPPFSEEPLDLIIWGQLRVGESPNELMTGGFPSAGIQPPKSYFTCRLEVKIFSRNGHLIEEGVMEESIFMACEENRTALLGEVARKIANKISAMNMKMNSRLAL